MPERVLVTGAGGFLGMHICRYFGSRGHSIAALGRFRTAPESTEFYPSLWKLCGMTLPDSSFTTVVKEFQPTLVVHCAGTSSVPASVAEPYRDFKHTVDVCASVLETLRKEAPGCRFVLISSASVYGDPETLPIREDAACQPISPYGFHKQLCEVLTEEYRQLHGVSTAILRVFSAYGEQLRKQVVYDLCHKFVDDSPGPVQVMGTGLETRDFIHAQDVAQAVECVHFTGGSGIFNVASGTPSSIAQLVKMIKLGLASDKTIEFSGHSRPGDPLFWQADIERLRRLGFEPRVSLESGIASYCNWFMSSVRS